MHQLYAFGPGQISKKIDNDMPQHIRKTMKCMILKVQNMKASSRYHANINFHTKLDTILLSQKLPLSHFWVFLPSGLDA
jgi:hypothetical protein